MGKVLSIGFRLRTKPLKRYGPLLNGSFGFYLIEDPQIHINLFEFIKWTNDEDLLINAISECIAHEYTHAAIRQCEIIYFAHRPKEEEIVTSIHGAMKVLGEKEENNPE